MEEAGRPREAAIARITEEKSACYYVLCEHADLIWTSMLCSTALAVTSIHIHTCYDIIGKNYG